MLKSKSDEHLQFKLIENIHNDSEQEIAIRAKKSLKESLVVGREYLIGYIAWQVKRPSKEVVPKSGGAVLMSLPGAEPAIFPIHKGVNRLLSWDLDESLTSPNEMLSILLDGLKSDDFQVQNFFVTELITRKTFMQEEAVEQTVKAMILNDHIDWRIKHFILAFGDLDQKMYESKWYKKWAVNTLKYNSTQLDRTGSEAALVMQLLTNSKDLFEHSNLNPLTRWVASNHSGLVETALDVLKIIDLDLAIEVTRVQLAQTVMHNSMYVTLENYLTRLNNQKKKIQVN